MYQIKDVIQTNLYVFGGVVCQDEETGLSNEQSLCEDKSAGELFRLKAGEDSCRDVIQCTAAVRSHTIPYYTIPYSTIP